MEVSDTGFRVFNAAKSFGPLLARNPCLCLQNAEDYSSCTPTVPTTTVHFNQSASTNQQLFHAHGSGRSLKDCRIQLSIALTASELQDTQRRCHSQARWRTTRESRRSERVSDWRLIFFPLPLSTTGWTICAMRLPLTVAN